MRYQHPTGLWVDAETGVVFGVRGRPVGTPRNRGYVLIQRWETKKVYHTAHRMIWEAVNGPVPAGVEINHINGIKHDNRLCNLELVTRSQNVSHAYRLGLIQRRVGSIGYVHNEEARAKMRAARARHEEKRRLRSLAESAS